MTNKEKRERRAKVMELLYSTNREDFKLGYTLIGELKLKVAVHDWYNISKVSFSTLQWLDFCEHAVYSNSPKKVAYWYRYER